MVASMKDHRAAVNCIMVSPQTGAEAISASSDGCCIIWDLETMKRRTSFFSNTFFKSVAFHPDESQVRALYERRPACANNIKTMLMVSVLSGTRGR